MSVLRKNIDTNPYTGKININEEYLRLSTKESLNHFFDGTPSVEQVKGVTRGKVYKVVAIEGFGDCEDVTIIDDNGNELELADFFFEEL